MLKPHHLSVKNKKRTRVGRGIAAGKGKTAGRGTKGQKSRSGRKIPRGFEGGQMPLKQRLPKKRGFRGKSLANYLLKLSQLAEKFRAGEEVNKTALQKKNLLPKGRLRVKIVKDKEIKKKLVLAGILVSREVRKTIEKAGGKIIGRPKIKTINKNKRI